MQSDTRTADSRTERCARPARLDAPDLAARDVDPDAEAGQVAIPDDGVDGVQGERVDGALCELDGELAGMAGRSFLLPVSKAGYGNRNRTAIARSANSARLRPGLASGGGAVQSEEESRKVANILFINNLYCHFSRLTPYARFWPCTSFTTKSGRDLHLVFGYGMQLRQVGRHAAMAGDSPPSNVRSHAGG